MFKDEAGSKQIEEFVGLRAKLYSYKICNDGKEEKKCQGIKKAVAKKYITHDDYKRCLLAGEEQMKRMNVIRSYQHEMYSEEVNKITLSADDDKKQILEDKIHTLAHGHYKMHVK